jgi:MOSC domain-containing protein YiiM
MISVTEVRMSPEEGLEGDHYRGRSGHRHVTLVQAEHLAVIASCMGLKNIAPECLRRNLIVSGINLRALRDKVVAVGEVKIEITGLCHPCRRMAEILGPGG